MWKLALATELVRLLGGFIMKPRPALHEDRPRQVEWEQTRFDWHDLNESLRKARIEARLDAEDRAQNPSLFRSRNTVRDSQP